MALKVDYVTREVFINLRRNITLTVATVATVAVSLALVGAAFLIRQGAQNATERWQGGIEFIVFVSPEAPPEQNEAIGNALKESPQVERVTYVDQEAAYEEFTELFQDSPDMVDNVTPDILPPSYRVVPRDTEAEAIEALGDTFENRPGVREVVFAAETVKTVQRMTTIISNSVAGGAVILLGAAGLLILNTIRMAMFARRREIEVMKLVGATNWFIRVPFMVEGLLQGLFGAVLSVGATYGLSRLFDYLLDDPDQLLLLNGFATTAAEVRGTSILLLLLGCAVGLIGSFIAVTRFLDV